MPQELSIQAFLLYQILFLYAADICRRWEGFGGLAGKLPHLSTVLALDVTENAGLALSYHRALSQKLCELARQRTVAESEFVSFLSADNFPILEQAKRENALAASPKAPAPRNAPVRQPWTQNDAPA